MNSLQRSDIIYAQCQVNVFVYLNASLNINRAVAMKFRFKHNRREKLRYARRHADTPPTYTQLVEHKERGSKAIIAN